MNGPASVRRPPPRDPWLVGVTGGIGSGKTTLCDLLARERSWPKLDADRLGHEALAPPSPLRARIVERFGPAIVREDGSLARPLLAEIVFHDPRALADLNGIVHPWILSRIAEEAARLRGGGYDDIILLDAALLLDWRDRIRPRWIVVVVAPVWRRLRRLRLQGMPRAQALRRMRSQTGDRERLLHADWVVRNQGTEEELAGQARALAAEIAGRRRAAGGTSRGR